LEAFFSPFLKFGHCGVFVNEMKKQGCQYPPYYSLIRGWRKGYKYNLGNWVVMYSLQLNLREESLFDYLNIS
jgi:hypothetical protein